MLHARQMPVEQKDAISNGLDIRKTLGKGGRVVPLLECLSTTSHASAGGHNRGTETDGFLIAKVYP